MLRKSALAALCGVLLLSGCAAGAAPASSPAATRTAAPTATPTPTETATPTPAAEEVEAERLDEAVAQDVNLYGLMVCGTLNDYPETNVNDMVAKVLASSPSDGFSDEQRAERARRVLTDAAAENCPEHSERIAADLSAG